MHGLVEPASCVKSVGLFPAYLHNAHFTGRTFSMNEVNILGDGHFSLPSGQVILGTIIFMLSPPTCAEGIVILFNSLSYVGYTDDSHTDEMCECGG